MINTNTVPCEDCQKVLNKHASLEYLYCGHHRVVAFRFPENQVDFIAVNSTEEAIEIIQESGQEALPLQVPA